MHILWRSGSLAVLCLACSTVNAQSTGSDAELSRLQGKWRVTELVDDGTVIPEARIKAWLPSGGQVEIIDNSLVFTARLDGKKSAKTFSIDPATYPKQIIVVAREKVESRGIYRFDNGRLIVCLGTTTLIEWPKEFSAHQGSRRMMMVLERYENKPAGAKLVDLPPVPNKTTPPPATTTTGSNVLSDRDVANMLIGTWRLNDGAGLLDITFNRDGTFRSYREAQDLRTFHTVFVQFPISSGSWSVQQGTLTAHVTKSTRLDRVDQTFRLSVRTISKTDLVFADSLGRVGQATKLH